jgi:single-stranded DNA-binding protein
MTIDCAFFGFLAADADARTSQAKKLWVRLRIGCGKDDDLQWLSVAVFGKAAEAAAKLKKGDRCYVEGTISMSSWTGSDGTQRHGLSVAAFKCDQTHRIGRGRDKPQRAGQDEAPAAAGPFDDSIPFAPEWR